ncbi:CHAD domain-containing protein [Pseudomonadota bacterium]
MVRKGTTPSQIVEVEFKFELTPEDVRRLLQAPQFKAMCTGPARRKTLRATYFDTPDFALAARSIPLRVRKESRRYVQCIKNKASDDLKHGGFARHEREWQVPGPDLDVALLRGDPEVKAMLKGISLRKLVPLFSTDIKRQSRTLTTPGGAEIACDIDQGAIIAGDARAPLYELELELERGNVSELLELARLVGQIVPARLSSRSKALRGYTLVRGGPTWVRAFHPPLPKTSTAGEVLQTSVQEGLKHLIANEDCVLHRCDIEGVHQMRVAMRRMRSVIVTYKRMLPKGSYEDLAADLKTSGNELGPARDWDVFLDEILPPVEQAFPGDKDLAVLRARSKKRQHAGYKRARHLIQSAGYARLLTEALHWASNTDWHADVERLSAPATIAAKEILARRYARVIKAGQGLADLPVEKRHLLRIQVKKMRYGAEFFAELYPDKRTKPFVTALRALQDGLGHLNDLATAERLMADVAKRTRGVNAHALHRAAGLVEGWFTHAQHAREAELLKAWNRFEGVKVFW